MGQVGEWGRWASGAGRRVRGASGDEWGRWASGAGR